MFLAIAPNVALVERKSITQLEDPNIIALMESVWIEQI